VDALSNADLAELLADASQREEGMRQKALKRAARSAFLWPEEAAEILAVDRDLTELQSVGPYIATRLREWIETPPARPRSREPLREDFLTLAEARRLLGAVPEWRSSLRGDLHMHTNWSDGSNSVAEMAAAGIAAGYEYIAITDHSQGLKIAGGIDETAVTAQGEEIGRANETTAADGLTVLRSIELNINPKGEGDMTPDCLNELDLVLGSFHSALRKTDDQTDRYLAALRNPTLHVLGHPRGRVYNFRLGLTADWPHVFAEAARLDKAVEIDCYPDRQDLNVALLELARATGVRVSLGTDSHHAWQLEFIELGLAAARKAGLPADRIVNFLPLSELRAWVTMLRSTALSG
jgi:putative hydrolase